MVNTNQVAEVGLLVGEPARAAMLMTLMDGQALTASELARCAGVTPQTASSHLSRMLAASLLSVEKQGRHRYFRLASPEIARMLEGIMRIASHATVAPRKVFTGPRDEAMRTARTCYDHFAGRLGVAIADAMARQGVIRFEDEAGIVTTKGLKFFEKRGIALPLRDGAPGKVRSKRPLCRPCLDWSERRPHIAGGLGASICEHFLDKKYVRRVKGTRAVEITHKGHDVLREAFGVREV